MLAFVFDISPTLHARTDPVTIATLSCSANLWNVGGSVVIAFDDKGWVILIEDSAAGSQTEGRSAFLTDGL